MPSEISIKNKNDNNELIKVAPFRKKIRKTEPHKHSNYFEIVYLSSGNGIHVIDYHKYNINPPTLFFIRKEQVHHWEISDSPNGYVLILKKAFVEKSLDYELKALFKKISSLSCVQLSDTTTIERLFELLTVENNFSIIEGLLKALLAKIIEVTKPIVPKTKSKEDLFSSFKELLNQGNSVKNSVAYYAGLLNTTPQNLTMICRKAVNQPANEILAEFIIGEAKRLLLYTNNTISEIAYTLGFSDSSHFIKYFKRHTKNTPLTFRLS